MAVGCISPLLLGTGLSLVWALRPPGSRMLRLPELGGPAFRGPDATERAKAAQCGSWPADRALRTGLGSSHQDSFQIPDEVQRAVHVADRSPVGAKVGRAHLRLL